MPTFWVPTGRERSDAIKRSTKQHGGHVADKLAEMADRSKKAIEATYLHAMEAKRSIFEAQDAIGYFDLDAHGIEHAKNIRELLTLARSALEAVDREALNYRDGLPAREGWVQKKSRRAKR